MIILATHLDFFAQLSMTLVCRNLRSVSLNYNLVNDDREDTEEAKDQTTAFFLRLETTSWVSNDLKWCQRCRKLRSRETQHWKDVGERRPGGKFRDHFNDFWNEYLEENGHAPFVTAMVRSWCRPGSRLHVCARCRLEASFFLWRSQLNASRAFPPRALR